MIMGHMGDTVFFCQSKTKKKNISRGHVGDTAVFAREKTRITTFEALGGLAFDSAYDMR